MSGRGMSIIAPHVSWICLKEAAIQLDCVPAALYRYIERRGGIWHLKPLDEAKYRKWHRKHWAPSQEPGA